MSLSGQAKHFTLDQRPGIETIHTIVATRPMPELMARYRDGLANRNTFAALQSKGIYVVDDRSRAGNAGRLLACLKEPGYCREEFRIKHLN